MASNKRSPLKDNPLRNPGQSAQEKRTDIVFDKMLQPALIAWLLIVLAAMEWTRYVMKLPPAPLLYSSIAVLGVIYAAFRIVRAMPEARALRLAVRGEKAVGQFLEGLRVGGYQIFHDVVGKGFNIDHVIVGPAGIFTIETKTYSKLPGPDVTVRFDGKLITVDGLKLDRDPVAQAKGQAAWLREVLNESTGRTFNVRPVVLFPGWFVEQTGPGTTREIWVLNPKAFVKFLENEPPVLEGPDLKLASYHLSRYIRSSEEK